VANPRLTQQAREDLLHIWTYIAHRTSLQSADRIYDQIEEACAKLGTFPEVGRARPEIGNDARSIVVARWVVLYRVVNGVAHIVRVIDGARDIANVGWTSD
jgi:toxin ParE1/3/4